MTHHASTDATTTPCASSLLRYRRSTPILDELDREWSRLRRRPASLETVRSWTASNPGDDAGHETLHRASHAATTLDELLDATQPRHVGVDAANETVCALIELSQVHPLASRIVLQRMLGALIAATVRWQRMPGDDLPASELIGAAWISIHSYDTTTRRHQVVPALVSDAVWLGLRRERRRRSASEVPIATEKLAERAAPEHRLEAITALAATLRAAAVRGVDEAHIEFIEALAAAGSPTNAARIHRVTPRTIRNRRDAAAASIRGVLGPDWSDWSDPLVNVA